MSRYRSGKTLNGRIAFSAGPAYAAVAICEVPVNEKPIIPILPSDHGCLAAHATAFAPPRPQMPPPVILKTPPEPPVPPTSTPRPPTPPHFPPAPLLTPSPQ